jgi:hypothetical protein
MADEEIGFEYVSFDPDRSVLRLRLPPQAEHYREQLLEELIEEFLFEPHTAAVEKQMNEYVRNWITQRHTDQHQEPGPAS